MTEIANGLSEKYNVRVITCNNAYIANGSQSDLQLDNRIKVVYAKSPNLSKNNLFGRLIRLFISGYNLYKTAKK
ncbi:MAG: hypothetical protein IKC42_02415, partial [Alistipes sp.]|nr:hypothetical protein [Alistipes sp.]